MNKLLYRKRGIENSLILYVLLFLACLNFLGRGPVFFLFFCLWGCIKSGKVSIRWNVSSICYLLMTITASAVSLILFDEKEVVKSFVYFLSFVVGYKGYKNSSNRELFIKRIIFVVFAGFLCNLIITYYINFVVIGHIAGQRELYSFWTNELMSVTLAGLMSSIPIAYSFYCFFCKSERIYKVLCIISVGVVFLVNMGTATRTPFVLMGVVYIIMLYVLFQSKVVKHKVRLILLLSIVFGVLIYKILPALADSALGQRFDDEGIETSRIDITIVYLGKMFDYPFGGSEILAHTHLLAHNFILESYDMYGVFFFIPMIVLFLLMGKRFFEICRIKNKNDITLLLMTFYLTISLQIMLEPVIGGYPQLVWILFMIDGMSMLYLSEVSSRNKHKIL